MRLAVSLNSLEGLGHYRHQHIQQEDDHHHQEDHQQQVTDHGGLHRIEFVVSVEHVLECVVQSPV